MNMRPVLFVIDMQTIFLRYFNKETRDRLLETNIGMISYCAEHDIPILNFEYFDSGNTNKHIQKALEKASRTKKITKYSDSAFSTRKTNKYLKELETDSIILSGINMSACILDSAKASVRNYETLSAEDLTADSRYAKENNRYALKYLDSHCKLFEKHEELIEYLDRRINYKLKLSAFQ